MGGYLIGKLVCNRNEAGNVVDGVNYLRCVSGVSVSCLRVKPEEDGKVIVPLLYKGPKEFAQERIGKVIDIGEISWMEFSPRASNPKSIKMARIVAASIEMKGEISLNSILPEEVRDPFAGLCGLGEQKLRLKRMADAIAAFGDGVLESRNLVFKGSPGTGKTSAAGALAAYCYQRGVTKTPNFVAVSAADIVAQHLGETPKLVRQAFARAEGGVLMIDEAPSIVQGGSGDDFGIECVNAINEAMDRLRSRVMVVVAGYTEEMDLFLASNPGLSSRFSYEIVFPDYGDKELADIYMNLCAEKGFKVDQDAKLFLDEKIGSLRNLNGFANARTVRKLYDATVLSAAQLHPQTRSVTTRDLESAFAEAHECSSRVSRVGFA